MRVREITTAGDWTFGSGLANYKVNSAEVAQSIKTRLKSFLGDCFFDTGAGIDWFNFLGGKNELALNLAISATILNTTGVMSLVQVSSDLDASTRLFTVNYTVLTIYQTTVTETVYAPVSYLTTEDGDFLITEDGDSIIV